MKIDEIVSNIIKTLRYYESGFTSVKRNPVDPQERVNCLSHFIECRFNFECFKINELRHLEELTDGRLFTVSSIINEKVQSYDRITLEVSDKIDLEYGIYDYDCAKNTVINTLGGHIVSFSSDINNLSIIIE